MDSELLEEMSVPFDVEEAIDVQQRLQSEIVDVLIEYDDVQTAMVNNISSLCNVNDASWIADDKDVLMNALLNFERISIPLPETKTEKYLALLEMLQKENEQQLEHREILEHDSKILEQSLKADENALRSLKDEVDSLESRRAAAIRISKQTKKEFQTMRKYLHDVLDLCFKETSVKILLQDLTYAYFDKEKNAYIDINDGYSFADVELLKSASLITEHPTDNMKIKFRNLHYY